MAIILNIISSTIILHIIPVAIILDIILITSWVRIIVRMLFRTIFWYSKVTVFLRIQIRRGRMQVAGEKIDSKLMDG